MGKMIDRDISKDCTWGNPDDEMLPLTRCPCGRTWATWEFNISIYRENPVECQCGRKLYFTQSITVWEVVDEEPEEEGVREEGIQSDSFPG